MRPMLSVTQNVLKIFGFKDVHTAWNADEAFTKFCQYSPDIVITDWQMEPFDGIALTHKIRTDPTSPNPFVPIILMTGYSAMLRVIEARDTGVTEFLVKPFTANDLFLRLEALVEKPRNFVDSNKFFGPDRRRKRGNYDGSGRRHVDNNLSETGSSQPSTDS